MKTKNKLFMVLIPLLLILATLACGLPSLGGDESDVDNPSTSNGSGGDSDEQSTIEEFKQVEDFEVLDSYRMTAELTNKDGQGNTITTMTITYEWVKENNASHSIISDSTGDFAIETITIGDTTWVKSPFGEGWVASTTSTGEDDEAYGQIAMIEEDWEDLARDDNTVITYIGTETVNGVKCRHFRYETSSDTSQTQSTNTADAWIADESNLPKIVVRMEYTMESTDASGQVLIMEMVIDVTDINEPITIEPPE